MTEIELTATEAEMLELAAEQGGHVVNFSKHRHDTLVVKKLVGWNAAAQAWWLTDRGRAEARKRGWLV